MATLSAAAGRSLLGHVVFLENQQPSIEGHLDAIRAEGLTAKVCQRPLNLSQHLDKLSPEKPVTGFVLDLHMKNILTLEELALPHIPTEQGEGVGLAVAEFFLRPTKSYASTPVIFLTGFPVKPEIRIRIEKLTNADLIFKTAPVEEFASAVRELMIPKSVVLKPIKSADLALYREGVTVVSTIAEAWGLSEAERALLLGFRLGRHEGYDAVSTTAATAFSVDIDDRIRLIVELAARLENLLGADPLAQARWLKTRLPHLGDRTPLQLLSHGHLSSLAQVVSLTRLATG